MDTGRRPPTEVERFRAFRDSITGMTVPEDEQFDADWKTVHALVLETGSKEKFLWQLIEEFLSDKKDKKKWLKRRPAENNSFRLHLHPTLVAFIREQCQKRERAPEGWKTIMAMAEELGVDFGTIEKEVVYYRDKHKEWFKPYLDANGSEREHLHPDMIYILSMLHEIRSEAAPEGWMTNTKLWTELTKEFSLDKRAIQAIAEREVLEHPDWIKPYRTPDGKFVPHYHPELVAMIREDVAKNKKKR